MIAVVGMLALCGWSGYIAVGAAQEADGGTFIVFAAVSILIGMCAIDKLCDVLVEYVERTKP